MEKAPCTDFLAQVRSPGRVASYPWREQCRQARRRSRRGLPPREPPPGMPPYLLPSEDALPDPKEESSFWPSCFSYSSRASVLAMRMSSSDTISGIDGDPDARGEG